MQVRAKSFNLSSKVLLQTQSILRIEIEFPLCLQFFLFTCKTVHSYNLTLTMQLKLYFCNENT